MKIVIDTDDIVISANSAGEFVFDGDAEKHLLNLIETQDKLEKVIAQVKKKLAEEGLKLNPHFSGVRGDSVKVGYSAHGAVYAIEDAIRAKDFVISKTTYSIDKAKVDDYVKNNGGEIPDGIAMNDRKKSITISKVKK